MPAHTSAWTAGETEHTVDIIRQSAAVKTPKSGKKMDGSDRKFFSAGRPNFEDDRWLLWSVIWFPILFVAVILCVKVFTPGIYLRLIREDGIVEWSTALAYAAGSGFAFLLALRLWRGCRVVLAALYGALAAGMLFVTFEEISWGQRILGLEASGFFIEHSVKEEINIHNLEQFPLGLAFIAVGFYGAFSRLLATSSSALRRFPCEVELLTPRYAIAPYFLLTFVLYTYYEYVFYTIIRPLGITIRRNYQWEEGAFVTGRDQEPAELLLAIGFLIFAFNNYQRHKALNAAAPSAERLA